MKLFRIFILSMAICGGARAGDSDLVYTAGNIMQVVSFHYGFTRDLHSVDSEKVSRDRFGGIIGASVGWNYFVDKHFNPSPAIPSTDERLGFGLRLKYLYMDTYALCGRGAVCV